MAKHTLYIKENGTFEYHLKGDLLDVSSNGTWRLLDQKELILESNKSLRSGVIDFVEEINSSTKKVNIELMDENGQPLSYAAVTVNGKSANGFNVNENGSGSYETTDLKSLTINYLGSQYEYVLTKPKTNKLILTIRLQSEATMFFNNEVWKVQKKKLVGKNNLTLRKK
jgi:hypothetical protein